MILKAHFRLFMVLAALAIAGLTHAAPQTITHQGRLLGSDDKPVADGIYGATFSLWDDPVAGNMVWSEIQDIQTRSGLFSVELGQVSSFFDIFTDDRDLYLQTQVQIGGGMQELLPRLRLGTVPFASTAKRVHSIHNGPAMRTVSTVAATDSGAVSALSVDLDGDGASDRRVDEDCDDTDASVSLSSRAAGGGGGAGGLIHLSAADFSSSSSMSVDLDGDGIPDRSIDQDCDDIASNFRMRKRPEILYQAWDDGINLYIDELSSSSVVAHDLDSDGAVDMLVSSVCDATSAKHAINTKGTGAQGGRVASVSSSTSDAGATFTCQLDMDGDAVPDRGIDDDCDDFSSSRSMSFFDVFTEMTIDQDCDATGARLAINSKGTSAKRTVACSTDESSSSVVATGDLDGDGLDDSEAALRISPTQSSLAIKTKGTGAQRFRGGTDCDDTDAHNFLDCDDDGDGLAESSVSSSSSSDGADFSLSARMNDGTPARISTNFTIARQTQQATFGEKCYVDGDDVPESQIEQRCSPDSVVQVAQIGDGSSGSSYNMRTRLHELEAILKNFGLLGTGRAMQACGDGSSSVSCDLDVDNNSIVDGTAWEKVDNTDASCGASTDSNQDGTPDVSASIASSATRSELKGYFQSGDVPTQSQFSTLLDSDGARSLLSGGMSGSTTATIRMSAAPDSTVFDLGYHGSTTGTIRLMASSSGSDNPIEHSSGAHLTPGGVWTNASDENLKENFQPVDGEEILEKIEQLEITQWNYKNESDEVTHIGPTAQDFQKTFGVGSDGKSISTIDPSGIALVAVKELRKENQELKAQVEELKKMVDQLAKKR